MSLLKVIVKAPGKPLNSAPVLPPSKSMLIRIRLMEFLSSGKITTDTRSEAEDVLLMEELLWWIKHCSSSLIPMVVDVKNSGAVGRFLLAALSALPGKWFVTGNKRMKQRPLGPLLDALLDLGADLRYTGRKGFLPVLIRGRSIPGNKAVLESKDSSQYLSALLMSLSFGDKECLIKTSNALIHDPYVKMTISLLNQVGISPITGDGFVRIIPAEPLAVTIPVEADWSSASFWFEIVALSPGSHIFLKGLNKDGLQGDAALPELFEELGVQAEFEQDVLKLKHKEHHTAFFEKEMHRHPDLVMPVAATCAGLGVGCKLSGVSRLRLKESDRLYALAKTFRLAGLKVNIENDDVFILEAGSFRPGKLLETFDDHRMAMCLAPLSLVSGIIKLEKPGVVGKSYPAFWEELKKAGFDVRYD